jgi:hypothetical protein
LFTEVNSYLRSRACGIWSQIAQSWIIGRMGESSDFVPTGTKFHFAQELKRARRALEERVAAYAAENPDLSYRDLCKQFSLSLGAMSRIVGRRKKPKASRDSFVVRHELYGQKFTTVVTVTGRASVEHKRLGLAERYRTQDIVEGNDRSILRRVEWTARSLELGRGHKEKRFEQKNS